MGRSAMPLPDMTPDGHAGVLSRHRDCATQKKEIIGIKLHNIILLGGASRPIISQSRTWVIVGDLLGNSPKNSTAPFAFCSLPYIFPRLGGLGVLRMSRSTMRLVTGACTALLASLSPLPAFAQSVNQSLPGPGATFQIATLAQVPGQMSSDCRVKIPAFEGRSPLRSMRRALRESRPIKVLAIGSSSTVGVGASSPMASYTVRLEHDLEGFLKGFDIDLIPRGMSGEVAEGTASRIKTEVAENKPDLVVWQVGTNDGVSRIGEEHFTNCLHTTLDWLAKNGVDVILINPQYVDRLASDDHYTQIVKIIDDVAREKRVLVVDRYKAMADLARQNGNNTYLASDRFHLNDLGYRCMAEYSARAIVSGILLADVEQTLPSSQEASSTPSSSAHPAMAQPAVAATRH